MKKYILLILNLIILSSCLFDGGEKISIEFLMENAVDTLNIEGANYTLDAYAWRDFMPGGVQDHSLNCTNTLIRIDSLEIPSTLDMVKQFVISGDSLWAVDYIDRKDTLYHHMIRRGSTGGPEWKLNSFVDVVSKIKFANIYYYLIKRNVKIVMTS